MNRIMCVAALAVGLMLATGGEAKAHGGFTFNPGSITLSGGIGLQWQGGGWTKWNNEGGYGQGGAPAYQGMPPYGYGPAPMAPAMPYGYGYAPAYGYGY